MNTEELKAIEARANAATPGPCIPMYVPTAMPVTSVKYGAVSSVNGCETARCWTIEDAQFVAHAYADIPALLTHIREVEAREGRLREALEECVAELEYWLQRADNLHCPPIEDALSTARAALATPEVPRHE